MPENNPPKILIFPTIVVLGKAVKHKVLQLSVVHGFFPPQIVSPFSETPETEERGFSKFAAHTHSSKSKGSHFFHTKLTKTHFKTIATQKI